MLRYCYTLTTVSKKKKKQTIPSVGEDVEQLERSHTAGWNINGAATLENSVAVPLKSKYRVTIRPSNSAPRYIPKKSGNKST